MANDVTNRFIEVYDYLAKEGKVAGKKDFAEKIGISASMMTEICKGRSNVGIATIQNIVTAFNVSADWLIMGHGDITNSPSVTPASGRNNYCVGFLIHIAFCVKIFTIKPLFVNSVLNVFRVILFG